MVLNKDFGAVLQMDLAIFGASQVHMMVNWLVIVVESLFGRGRVDESPSLLASTAFPWLPLCSPLSIAERF